MNKYGIYPRIFNPNTLLFIEILLLVSAGITVGIATGYWLDGRGSFPGRDRRLFSTPHLPDRLWGPPSLLSMGTGGFSP
jgi:hypothetical protein